MGEKYRFKYHVTRGGEAFDIEGSIEFSYNPDTYGNGHYMFIESKDEPFGGQAYDIRYDKRFRKDNKLLYIVEYLSDRFDGEDGRCKLRGVSVYEA